MPEYAFEDIATGEEVSIFQSMHDAVPIGDEVEMGGRRLRRLAQSGQSPIVSRGVAHVSSSLPEWSPGAHSYTADGSPRIDGQRDIDAIEKANPQFSHNNMKR
jgi:hypothetical protein